MHIISLTIGTQWYWVRSTWFYSQCCFFLNTISVDITQFIGKHQEWVLILKSNETYSVAMTVVWAISDAYITHVLTLEILADLWREHTSNWQNIDAHFISKWLTIILTQYPPIFPPSNVTGCWTTRSWQPSLIISFPSFLCFFLSLSLSSLDLPGVKAYTYLLPPPPPPPPRPNIWQAQGAYPHVALGAISMPGCCIIILICFSIYVSLCSCYHGNENIYNLDFAK